MSSTKSLRELGRLARFARLYKNVWSKIIIEIYYRVLQLKQYRVDVFWQRVDVSCATVKAISCWYILTTCWYIGWSLKVTGHRYSSLKSENTLNIWIYIFNNSLFYVSRYGRWSDLHLLLILVGLKISLVINNKCKSLHLPYQLT